MKHSRQLDTCAVLQHVSDAPHNRMYAFLRHIWVSLARAGLTSGTEALHSFQTCNGQTEQQRRALQASAEQFTLALQLVAFVDSTPDQDLASLNH